MPVGAGTTQGTPSTANGAPRTVHRVRWRTERPEPYPGASAIRQNGSRVAGDRNGATLVTETDR